MRSYFLPKDGPLLTDDIYSQSVIDMPLGGIATFAGSAAEAFKSTGVGSTLLEGQTPDIAKTPVAGGKGGVMWRDETPAEVAARGDKLFESPDAYKASEWFREPIPFETGMTESRARALAENYDMGVVREHFASKRPIAGFLGSLAGSAMSPENYIPIIGELGMAATSARIGKIAARALLTSSDAALNTVFFQSLSADQRERQGQDTSWAAIMQNAAYAAMAGAVLGGAFGTAAKFMERGAEVPSSKLTAATKTPPPSDIVTTGTVAARFDTQGFERTTSILPELFTPELLARERLETVAARADANRVLADATLSLAMDGEVRLGEGSKKIIAATKAKADQLVSKAEVDALVKEVKDAFQYKTETTIQGTAKPVADGAVAIPRKLGPVAQKIYDEMPENLRTELHNKFGYYDESGVNKGKKDVSFPLVMKANKYIKDAAKKAVDDIRKQEATAKQETKAFRVAVKDKTEGNVSLKMTEGGERGKPELRELLFDDPAPEPTPPLLKPSMEKVKARAAIDPTDESAQIARMVEDAKQEGFDPETGTHDLEDDIAFIREQGLLEDDELKALKAADETYDGAAGWQDVMNVAIKCVLK